MKLKPDFQPFMFRPPAGDPTDACPNCGIHRQYAGNPYACGEHFRDPGCFAPADDWKPGDTLDEAKAPGGLESTDLLEAKNSAEKEGFEPSLSAKRHYDRD